MPTALTLSSEFSPQRNRAWLVTLMFCGFTLGLAFGGAIAAILIPKFGWQGVFIFGGLVPLILTPIIWMLLPESLRFMAGKKRFTAEAKVVLRRLGVHSDADAEAMLMASSAREPAKSAVVGTLFNAHYRAGTLLLWLAFFCTLWAYYQISSWLPTVMTESGITVTEAATIGAMMPIGGTIGSLINAWLMDRLNPFLVLTASYFVAAVAIALIGHAIGHTSWIYCAVFFTGLGLSGAQTGANVLVSVFYTTEARATGVSWALAVGRIGSIVGSMTGGLLLAALVTPAAAFPVFAIPVVVAGLTMFVISFLYRGKASELEAAGRVSA